MKSKILFIVTLLLSASCGKSTVNAVPLSSDPESLEFTPDAGTRTVVVSCSSEPARIAANAKWCTVTYDKFSGNSVNLTVTVSENTGTSDRTTDIVVNENLRSLMIPVTQTCVKVPLEVSATSFDVESYGLYDGSFTVTSSGTPEISANVSWCIATAGKQGDDRKTAVTLYVGANRSEKPRVGEISIKCGDETQTVKISQKALDIATASTTALTPEIVFDAFRAGWNLGNHMDAYSNDVAGETAWGNPKCTQQTMDKVKAAGFSSVRIPVTWMGHIGEGGAYKIEDKWMDRVAEIVEYAHKAGLKVIINTHHDENNNESEAHWLNIKAAAASSTKNETIKDEIACVWSQIALKFRDCGEWLMFEPFNELQDGGWGWSSEFRANPKPQYKVLNEWNQTFVDVVRSTGGNNATRWLATVGYAQSSGSITIDGLEIPKDYTSANRIIVGFHDYDPYKYTLNDPLVEQWGHTADPAKRCSDSDEKNITDTFNLFKEAYLDKGIPVYIGEMGCSFHAGDDFKYQKYYIEYFCKAAADLKMPMFVWENGNKGTGAEHHAYLDHGTGAYQSDEAKIIIDLMVKAVSETSSSYTLQSIWDSAPANQ